MASVQCAELGRVLRAFADDSIRPELETLSDRIHQSFRYELKVQVRELKELLSGNTQGQEAGMSSLPLGFANSVSSRRSGNSAISLQQLMSIGNGKPPLIDLKTMNPPEELDVQECPTEVGSVGWRFNIRRRPSNLALDPEPPRKGSLPKTTPLTASTKGITSGITAMAALEQRFENHVNCAAESSELDWRPTEATDGSDSERLEHGFFHHHPMNFRAGEELHGLDFSFTASVLSEKTPNWLFRQAALALDSPYFDYCSALLIITNAILLGVQTEFSARSRVEEEPFFFRVSEKVFCVFFTLELALRLYVFRFNFFVMQGWKWNLFDCLVVTTQLLEELMWVIAVCMESDSSEGSTMKSFSVIRVIRILRLVRIIRLVRVMHLISELRTIIVSIFSTFQSLMWTLVLLFIIIYVLGVYITQLVNDELDEEDEVLDTLFGSLGRSILSLFQVISGGLEWNRVVTPLMDKISPLMAFLFCLYVAFSVFALMNVVTGVFVESALKTAKNDQDMVLLHRMKHLLKETDLDASGTICWGEFQAQLKHPEMRHLFQSLDLDPEEARDLFMLIDIDESGEISPEEFMSGCIRLRGSAKAIDMAAFMHEYRRSQKRWSAQWKLVESTLLKISRMVLLPAETVSQRGRPCSHSASEGELESAWTSGGSEVKDAPAKREKVIVHL